MSVVDRHATLLTPEPSRRALPSRSRRLAPAERAFRNASIRRSCREDFLRTTMWCPEPSTACGWRARKVLAVQRIRRPVVLRAIRGTHLAGRHASALSPETPTSAVVHHPFLWSVPCD
jgi:hypothetical protein